eukprot:s158_g6.t1
MSSLSWAWSLGAWYVVDYAKTGRSSCKEFRCRKAISAGELRIGIEAPEDDHRGSQLGWYHPSCLWKTFSFQKNANKKIESTTDIQNFHHLKAEDKELIQSLLDGKAPSSQAAASSFTEEATAKLRAKIVKKIEGNTMTLTGPTFQFKEDLKKLGAKFNGQTKAWVITKQDNDSFEEVLNFLAGKDKSGDDDAAAPKRAAKRQRKKLWQPPPENSARRELPKSQGTRDLETIDLGEKTAPVYQVQTDMVYQVRAEAPYPSGKPPPYKPPDVRHLVVSILKANSATMPKPHGRGYHPTEPSTYPGHEGNISGLQRGLGW